MSSTNLTDQLSKVAGVATKLWTVARVASSPLKLGALSVQTVIKWMVTTTVGRVVSVCLLMVIGVAVLKHQFTAVERMTWEAKVGDKNRVIEKKVVDINAETRHAQELARSANGWWDRITAVVVDGIFKVQPPHPIESETIDLINETRGKASTPRK